MTTPETEDDDFVHEDANPLLVPLEPVQAYLLDAIVWPITQGQSTDDQNWPVWDFVARTVEEKYPQIESAESVWASLPWIPDGKTRGNPYGLAWRKDDGGLTNLQPGEVVGLTITGLYQWAISRNQNPSFANHLAWLLARKVVQEQNLEKDPYKVGSRKLSLRSESAEFLEYRPERPYTIPNVAFGDILTHEFIMLATRANGQHEYDIQIGSGSLRRLRGITDAKSYVDTIWRIAAARRPRSFHESSLPLIQTLDYLGYVLKDHPEWNEPERLASGQEMQSVASIVLPVATVEEFGHRVSGMWNVLNDLHVPKATKEELKKLGYSHAGSINCLEVWLDKWVITDLNRPALVDALTDIRASRLVRNESIHLSEKARADAAAARKQLGLQYIITDWSGTWEIITSRLAGAFDTIREEVQSATHGLASEERLLQVEDLGE